MPRQPKEWECASGGCGATFPLSKSACPQCGHRYFPNVRQSEAEADVLLKRYTKAQGCIRQRNLSTLCDKFQSTVELNAKVLMTVPWSRLVDLVREGGEYMTFYQRSADERQQNSADAWDHDRSRAEPRLFGDEAKRNLHYAIISLDERGVRHYGSCPLV